MRRHVPAVFAFVIGFALALVTGSKRQPPPPPVNFAGEITVRRALGPTERYKPHSVLVEERQVYIDHTPIGDAPVTVFTFDSGRVQVAATAVAE